MSGQSSHQPYHHSTKIDKKAIKGPDVFVSTSDKVFLWIQKHSRSFLAVSVSLIVLGVGWVAYSYFQTQAEAKAANALFAPESELKKAETQVREERAKKMQELAGISGKGQGKGKSKVDKMDPELLRPVDYAKDYAPSVKKFKAELERYAGRRAALVSAMSLSSFLLAQKQYGEALDVINIPRFQPKSSDILNGFWQMHRGLTFLENKKLDEAIKIYQNLTEIPSLKAFHPEALLKLGLALEMKGDAVKARQTYEKLGRDFPNTDASSSAQQYLRLLDIKSQQG